ncbi:MAG: hypothetical protein EOM54_11520 [Clostridia bacterium]|nr:hypothetical protein [Clostridia bacterium]
MKLKKLLVLILCAAMLISAVSGCAKKDETADSTDGGIALTEDVEGPIEGIDGSSSSTGSTTDETASTHDFDKAYAAYTPDTVMAVVDGETVTWQQVFYWMYNTVNNYETNYQVITDFDAICYGDVTFGQYILENAMSAVLYYKAIEEYASERGIALTADDEASIKADYDASVEQLGSEEALAEKLESTYCTTDYYQHLLRCSYLNTLCFKQDYGENGEKLSDEDAVQDASADGYMMAKHILFRTTDDSGNALSDEDKAAKYKKAEDVLAQLTAAKSEDVLALFDTLMNENSEDSGLSYYPNGYLFQSGEMISEFEDAVVGLKEGEYSGIVETSYGYHIIMRLPIDFDATPTQYTQYGYTYTLRYVLASDRQKTILNGLTENMDVQKSDTYSSLSLSKIF